MDNGAFLNSQVACAMIEAMGMKAENDKYIAGGQTPIYLQQDFQALISKYQIGINDALTILRG